MDTYSRPHEARGGSSSPVGNTQWDWGWSNLNARMPMAPDVANDMYMHTASSAGAGWPPNVKASGASHGLDSLPVRPTSLSTMPTIHGIPNRKEGTINMPSNERSTQEISTLFLAGFPDDITDREFSNMFLFAKGFEASMLKYPNTGSVQKSEESMDAMRTNERSRGLVSEKDQRERSTDAQANSKSKQIIGFAKFTAREEALQARDVLNGFRIDSERGCILKAELAKKNLHTKRSAPFVVNKHINPTDFSRAMSARDGQHILPEAPMSAPVLLSQACPMSASVPHQPANYYVGDPRVTWNEGMDQQHPGMRIMHETNPHVVGGGNNGTGAPLNEMVARLESFSKTIPTYAKSGSSLPGQNENSGFLPARSSYREANIHPDASMMTKTVDYPHPHHVLGSNDAVAMTEQQLHNLSLMNEAEFQSSNRNVSSPLSISNSSALYESPPSNANTALAKSKTNSGPTVASNEKSNVPFTDVHANLSSCDHSSTLSASTSTNLGHYPTTTSLADASHGDSQHTN